MRAGREQRISGAPRTVSSSVEELLADPGPGETIAYSCPPQIPGVQLLAVANSGRLCRVYHETYTVCTILAGEAEWSYRGRTHRSEAGGLMIMEPGELHATKRINKVGTYRVVLIPASVMHGIIADEEESAARPHFAVAAATQPHLFRSFAAFHRSAETGASALEQQSRLANCIRDLLKDCAERRPQTDFRAPPSHAVAKARDLLNDTYRVDVPLAQLAATVGLSGYQLCKAFAREVGMPPHAYRLQIRLARAQQLLRRDFSPAEAAVSAGFYDQSHLTRHFRAAFGVTRESTGR